MLSQSMAFDLRGNHIQIINMLDELIELKLVDSKRIDLGQSYFLTDAGVEYCKQRGLI